MVQKNEVLTREDNRISRSSTRRTATQEDYLAIAEIEMPMDIIKQAWIFEVGDETRVSRTTPRLGDTMVKVVNWLSHLGSGKTDDSCLEARHNIHHNFRANNIRF